MQQEKNFRHSRQNQLAKKDYFRDKARLTQPVHRERSPAKQRSNLGTLKSNLSMRHGAFKGS